MRGSLVQGGRNQISFLEGLLFFSFEEEFAGRGCGWRERVKKFWGVEAEVDVNQHVSEPMGKQRTPA